MPDGEAPVDTGEQAEALFDAIMDHSDAPEDEAEQAAPPETAKEPQEAGESEAEAEAEGEDQQDDDQEEPETSDETSDDGEEAEEDYVEFEGDDGETVRVTLADLVEKARAKPAPLVDEKAVYERVKTEFERDTAADRAELLKEKGAWSEAAKRWTRITGAPQPPDPEMLNPNSEKFDEYAYRAAERKYLSDKQRWDTVQGQIAQIERERSEAQQEEFKAMQQREIAALAQAWPELASAETGKKVQSDLLATAQAYGITPEEVGELVDHRQFLVLRDAMKYRALQEAKGPEAVKKKAKPKLVKAAARTADAGKGSKMSAETRSYLDARKRLKKTGKMDAADAEILLGPELFD